MAFDSLIDSLELIITIAPIFLLIAILTLIWKFLEPYLKLALPIIIIGLFLIPIDTIEAEPIEPMYTDTKGFDYLAICNIYPSYNNSDHLGSHWLGSTPNGHVFSNSTNLTKIPDKTIYWQNTSKNTLNLISKMVYNWTDNDIFKIRLMYVSNTTNTYSLPFLYSEYADSDFPNNISVTGNYTYLDGGKRTFENTNEEPQRAMQRLSNINFTKINVTALGDTFYGGYKYYEKRKTEDTNSTVFNVSRIKYKDKVSINTNTWITLTINPKTFYHSGRNEVYKSSQFINLGIIKQNLNDIVIIDKIEVRFAKIPDSKGLTPFKEYYEFTHLSDNTERTLLMIDLIRNDYETLYIDSVNISVNHIGQVTFKVYGYDYTIDYLINNFDVTVSDGTFIGYQLTFFHNPINGSYSIQLFFKYLENTRSAGGVVTYYYDFYNFHLYLDGGFLGILNTEFYETNTDSEKQFTHTYGSKKWDQSDNAFTRIDIDNKGDTLLIKNIDSSGFRIPSLNDLGKMIFNVIKPLFSAMEVMTDNILVPINSLIDVTNLMSNTVSAISGVVQNIDTGVGFLNTLLTGIDTLLTGIDTILSNTLTTLTTLSGVITVVKTTLTDFYNNFMAAYNHFGGLYGLLSAFISALVAQIALLANTFITFYTNAGTTIITFFDLTFSIMGASFIYFLVFRVNKYAETGDVMDLWAVFEVLEKIAEFIKWLFWLAWSVIP